MKKRPCHRCNLNPRPSKKSKFCDQCRKVVITKNRSRPRGDFLERFWKRVAKSDGCWLWIGAGSQTKRMNYGSFTIARDHSVPAHRVAYMLFFGDPGNLLVCHHCDVPRCVRPDHLFLGSYKDNSDDKYRKGRQGNVGRPRKSPRQD